MRIRMDDGREFEGTPTQIVQQMQSIAFGRDNDTLSDYIDWVKRQTQELMGIELQIKGATAAEKATSLIDEMLRTHLAARVGRDT
jgi:hypothetical protein